MISPTKSKLPSFAQKPEGILGVEKSFLKNKP
jgi:hypothetical protein